MLEIIYGPPPSDIYEACNAKFKVGRIRGVIYTVGSFLYNPDGVTIDPALMAHEQVHSTRQIVSGDINGWWGKYLEQPSFRFKEELYAHQREWEVIQTEFSSRQQRRKQLAFITERLSGPLYGRMVSKAEAHRLITGGSED